MTSADLIVEPGLLGEESDADLVKWLVEDGGSVAADQPVAELSTAKVVVELVSPATGTLRHLRSPGSVVVAGMTIGRIETP